MSFEKDLTSLLNTYSAENDSNTPDYILANYLMSCLRTYNKTIKARAMWYGRMDVPGNGSVPYPYSTEENVMGS